MITKNKRRFFAILALTALAFSLVAVSGTDWSGVSADDETVYAQGVTATSDDGGVTVRIVVESGGAMPIYSNLSDRPWHQFASTAQRVIMPLGINTLSAGAFQDFTQLKSINLTYKIKSIGNGAFSGCTSLESIIIPANTTSIGDRVFAGCSSLKSIDVESGSTKYVSEDGVLLQLGDTATYNGVSGIQTYTLMTYPAMHHGTAYRMSDGVSSGMYVVPFGTTKIADYAFYNATYLWGVVITEAVETIGAHAFDGCTSLATIVIPNSVKSIGDYAFYNNTSAKILSLGTFTGATAGDVAIGSHAFDVDETAGLKSKLKFVMVAIGSVAVKTSPDSFPATTAGTYIAGMNDAALVPGEVRSIIDLSQLTTIGQSIDGVKLINKGTNVYAYAYLPDTEGLSDSERESITRSEGAAIIAGPGTPPNFFMTTYSGLLMTGTRAQFVQDYAIQEGQTCTTAGDRSRYTLPDARLLIIPASFSSLYTVHYRYSSSLQLMYFPYTITTVLAGAFGGLTGFNECRQFIISDANTVFREVDGALVVVASGNLLANVHPYDGVTVAPNGLTGSNGMRSNTGTGGVIIPDSYTTADIYAVYAGSSKFDTAPIINNGESTKYVFIPSTMRGASGNEGIYANNDPIQGTIDVLVIYGMNNAPYAHVTDETFGYYSDDIYPAGLLIPGKDYSSFKAYWDGKSERDPFQPYQKLVFDSFDPSTGRLTLQNEALTGDIKTQAPLKGYFYINTQDFVGTYNFGAETYHYVCAPNYEAYYDSASGLAYMVVEGKTLIVTGYSSITGAASDVTTIPSYTRNGAPWASLIASGEVEHIIICPGITSIGDYAFTASFNNVKSVCFNEELTSIGKYAFSGLNMEYVFIPKLVDYIGEVGTGNSAYATAFWGCNNLKHIDASVNNTHYASDSGCLYYGSEATTFTKLLLIPTALTGTVTVAEGADTVLPYAGQGSRLSAVDFNDVTYIGDRAFSGSSLLTVETKQVETISEYAFAESTSVSTITFAESDDSTHEFSVGPYAFDGCTGLSMMTMNSSHGSYAANSIPTMGKTEDKLWWKSGTDKISNIATNSYAALKVVDFFTVGEVPIEYEYFGYNLLWAFIQKTGTLRILMNDANIGYGTMPDNWDDAGDPKWSGTVATITSVEIGNGALNVAPYAFYNVNTENFVLPNTVNEIGASAFVGSSIRSIKAMGVLEIGDSAFVGTSLTTFTGSTVSEIGDSAFKDCTGLTQFELGSAKSVGGNAFSGTGLTSAVFGSIGSDADSIGAGAFDTASLKTVVFTSAVTSGAINSGAFTSGDWFLNGETGGQSISGAITAETYYLKDGLKLMGYIYDTNGAMSIEWNLQTGLLVIEGEGTYGTTAQYSTISWVSGENTGTKTEDGYTINLTIPEARVFTDISGHVTPAGVTAEVEVYQGDTPVESPAVTLTCSTSPGDITIDGLNLSTSVSRAYKITATYEHDETSISVDAYFLAHGETVSSDRPSSWSTDATIAILKGVPSIHDGFFRDLTGVSSVVLNSLGSMGAHAFEGCTGLTSISIPSDVTSIPDSAFAGCTNLAAVNFNAQAADIRSIAYNAFADEGEEISISVGGEFMGTISSGETPVMNGAVLRNLVAIQAQSTAVAKIVNNITVTSPIAPYQGVTVDFNGHVLSNLGGSVFSRAPTYVIDSNTSARNNFTYEGSWFLTEADMVTYAYTLGGALLQNGDLLDPDGGYDDIYYLLNLAVIAVSDSTQTYDGGVKTPPLQSVTLNGYVVKKDLYTAEYYNNVNAGEQTAYVIVSLNKLQSLRGTGYFTIDPAVFTLDFSRSSFATILDSDAQTFTYNGGNSFSAVAKGVLVGNVAGMKTYEDVPITIRTNTTNCLSDGYTYSTVLSPGTYTVDVEDTNYTVPESSSTRFLIEKADLRITVDGSAATKVYDGSAFASEITAISGLVNGDTVMTNPTVTTYDGDAGYYTYADSAAEGRYTMTTPIAISNASGSATSNYNLIWEGQIYIQPAHIVLYAEDCAKVVGGADPTLAAKALGLVNGETVSVLTYTVERIAAEEIGKYTIFVYGPEENGNYIVSYQNGTFTISDFVETVMVYDWQTTAGPAYGYVLKGTYTLGNGNMLTLPGSAKTVSKDGTTDYMYKGWIVSDSQQSDIQTDNPVYEAGETYVSTVSGAAKTTYIYATYGQKFTLKFFDDAATPAEIAAQTMDVFEGMTIDLPSFAAPYGSAFIGWSTANPATAETKVGTFGQKWIVDATGVTDGIVKLYPVLSKGYALEVRGFEYNGSAYTEKDPFKAYTVTVPSTISAASHTIMYIQSNGAYILDGVEVVAHGVAPGSASAGTAVKLDPTHWMIYAVDKDADILVKYSAASATDFGHSQFGITGFAPGSNNNAVVVYLKASGEAGLAEGTVSLKGTQYTVESGRLIYSELGAAVKSGDSPDVAAGVQDYTATFELSDSNAYVYWAYAEYEYDGQEEVSTGILGPTMHLKLS